jgi:DNA-directed RNA polymerase subunit L
MNVKILKKSENELKIEIQGASHGLCNLIQKRLLENKHVDFAGYDVPHPLASSPIIYLRMKGSNKPEDALIEAIERVKEADEAFGKEFEKALSS